MERKKKKGIKDITNLWEGKKYTNKQNVKPKAKTISITFNKADWVRKQGNVNR